jgi:hypothetical protein
MANVERIACTGDAVLYDGELYRVESESVCTDTGAMKLHLRNVRGTKDVYEEEVTHLGIDLLTPQRYKYPFSSGDYVTHPEHGITGKVVENTSGRSKVATYDKDGKDRLYVWPSYELQAATHEELDTYFEHHEVHVKKVEKHREKWSERYSQTWDPDEGYSYPSMRTPSAPPRHKAKPKPRPADSISTAGLIKDEVQRLEKEEESDRKGEISFQLPGVSTRPSGTVRKLRTSNGPRKSKPQEAPEADDAPPPVIRRKGDW